MRLFGTEKYPKGPSFRTAKHVSKDLGLASLSFMAPNPKPAHGGSWNKEPNHFNAASDAGFERELTWNQCEIESLSRLRVYSSSWEFRGIPVIEGYCGFLNCIVDIRRVGDLPANESLFDNWVLARELLRNEELCTYAATSEGYTAAPLDSNPDRWPEVLGPINSQWVNRNGTDWLYTEEQQLSDTANAVTWATPISHDRYLSCLFLIERSSWHGPNAYRIEERVRPDTFLDLMHQIMDSVKLELCEEMKAERDRIRTIEPSERRPVIEFTPEQLKVAKHVLYMSSFRKSEDGDDRWSSGMERLAPREEVEAFLDERVKFKPLPGSYPRGGIIYNRVPVQPITKLVDSLPQGAIARKAIPE